MVKIQTYPQGTRVRIREGSFPLDPSLVGRAGLVVHLRRYGGTSYGVQLDDESAVRVFDESELEPLGDAQDPADAGLKRAEAGSDAPA